MLLPLGLIALAVLVATASAISVQFHHQRETEATRMQAIAEVKTRQIADWLAERQGDANAHGRRSSNRDQPCALVAPGRPRQP